VTFSNNLLTALLCSVLIPASVGLSGCSTTITSHTANTLVEPASDGENRLWVRSVKFDEALEKSDSLYRNTEQEAYLNSILDKLFPEFKGAMNARILKAPILNAMALPNGSIYINSGLLAVMENEAQLATILAHEGEHFVQKHGPKKREHLIQAAGWGMVGGVLLAGAGIPADLATLGAISSISGYSREAESEADNFGYERLKKAGYEVQEAPKVFNHMIREIEAEEIKQPYFFSTHPKLKDRVTNFESLNNNDTSAHHKIIGETQYLDHFSELRIRALKAKLEMGQYKALIALLSAENTSNGYGNMGDFILAESYRLRDDEGDSKLARDAFSSAKKAGLNIPSMYKGIGLLEYKSGNGDKAANAFESYLKLAEQSDPERSFIQMYMEKLTKEEYEKFN